MYVLLNTLIFVLTKHKLDIPLIWTIV